MVGKYPEFERQISKLMDSVDMDDKEQFARVQYHFLQRLAALQEVNLLFKKVVAESFSHKDIEFYVAGIKVLEDALVGLVADNIGGQDGETVAKFISTRDTGMTTRFLDQATKGEYRPIAETGNMFAPRYARISLDEIVRELAERLKYELENDRTEKQEVAQTSPRM